MSRFRSPILPLFFLHFVLYSIFSRLSSSTVVVTGNNVSLSFQDIAANFAPAIKSAGVCGQLYVAEPLDACSSLRNNFERSGNCSSRIALIVRGHCSFEDKVRRAQKAGFNAVIVYDNEAGGGLIARDSAGIKIHAVFVSKASGEKLAEYAAQDNMEVFLVPSYENSAWSIMAISFISLLAMSAFLATCFFVRRHRIRRERPGQQIREFHGMSSRMVKAMPSLVFTSVLDDTSTSSTCCAICLEDYRIGEKIRVLPCNHKFHAVCVDCWLTSWRTFCPVCKRDARTTTGIPPASESTPLLSSTASSPQSIHSSLRSYSSFIQITSPSPQSHSTFNSPHHLPRPSRHPPSSMSMNRSSLDLRNMSARRSASQLISPSPHSSHLRYASMSPQNSCYMSPQNSRYMSPYMSSSYLGSASASRPPNPLRYSGSAASFSPFSSAHSLPDC